MADDFLKTIDDVKKETDIVNSFLGFVYRKQKKVLYSMDAIVPLSLLDKYYSGDIERLEIDEFNRAFIRSYIKNESLVEDVHDVAMKKGLGEMYEYMCDFPEENFCIYTLFQFHQKLFSKCPHPEFGGTVRNCPAVLEGIPIDLCEPGEITRRLSDLREPVEALKVFAYQMKYSNDYSALKDFVREVMKVECQIIKTHPFNDGNKRTTRCFANKLFIMAGLPPVYIKLEEKKEYQLALKEALRPRSAGERDDDSKYDIITNFYLYKLCDSIIELDINPRVNKEIKAGKYVRMSEQQNPEKKLK